MKGKNPNISPIIGEINGTPYKLINWSGWQFVTGVDHSTSIIDDIRHRSRTVKQNMLLIQGEPGEGKSWFALRLGQILDKNFDVELQVVFERSHLLFLIGPNSPLKIGSVIIIDESQYIAGARRWYENVQKDVMENIESVRSRGFVIIIVALHIELLDKIIRNYVLSHRIIMSSRGRAKCYRTFTPPFANKPFTHGMGSMALKIPDVELCESPSCLLCQYKEKCMTIRAIYERKKRRFLGKVSLQSQLKAETLEKRRIRFDIKEMIKLIVEGKDELVFKKSGKLNEESVKIILEAKDWDLPDIKIKNIIKRGEIRNPEVFIKLKEKKL